MTVRMTVQFSKCLYWLSFCDVERPAGEQFLGVSIVEGFSFAEAVALAHRLGVNPGGEVDIRAIPEHLWPLVANSTGRLLKRPEAEQLMAMLDAAASLEVS